MSHIIHDLLCLSVCQSYGKRHTHTHTHTHPYLKHLSVMCDALAIFILFPFVKKKNKKCGSTNHKTDFMVHMWVVTHSLESSGESKAEP